MKGGLGSGAIQAISKRIQKNSDYETAIRDTIFIGKRAMPLGRYLTKKLADDIGVPEKEFKQRFENILMEYNDPDNQDFENQGAFVSKLLDDYRGKRLSSEKRNKLYSAKKSL